MTGAPDVRADFRESGEISISLPGWLAYASAGAARDIARMITKCGSAAQVDVFVRQTVAAQIASLNNRE